MARGHHPGLEPTAAAARRSPWRYGRAVRATAAGVTLGLLAGLVFPLSTFAADGPDRSADAPERIKPRTHSRVSLEVTESKPAAGETVAVFGRVVSGQRAQARVVRLQRRAGKHRWDTLATSKTNKRGRYRIKVLLPSGQHVLRVATTATRVRAKAHSETGRVVVGPEGPVAVAAVTSEAQAPEYDLRTDTLAAGQTLANNHYLTSKNGRYRLVQQADGNLVLYDASSDYKALWANDRFGTGHQTVMQTDGNLVVYRSGRAVWDTHTDRFGPAKLVVQDDGNIVVYANGLATWSRFTGYRGATLMAGASMEAGAVRRSPNGRYQLIMQGDGNLVVYDGGTASWATSTTGSNYAVMQTDGNLVVYRNGGGAQWNSVTAGNAGARLELQDDGNLVVYNAAKALWSRYTGKINLPSAPAGDGYPDANAVDCSGTFNVYSWCKNGTPTSPRGFAYRNCTDYVAWRKGMTWSQIQYAGSAHAKYWKDGWTSRGRSIGTTPKVGAVAWWGAGNYGHVAYVIGVNSDGSARVAQYNSGGAGTYSEANVRAPAYLY